MTQYFSYSYDWLHQRNGLHTAQEITQQPRIWRETWQHLQQTQSQWSAFLTPLLADPQLEIILTGAGSSAFIGNTLAPWFREHTPYQVHSYGSTEIVSNPLQYLSPRKKTLLISYARSGNSPESQAVVELADQLIDDCYHLFITCNPDSALTRYAEGKSNIYQIITPEGTHDVGFAMTSSITSMMLSTVLVLSEQSPAETKAAVENIAQVCEQKMQQWQEPIQQLTQLPLQRIIYVGSGCFSGLAWEAALKVLELTAGKVASRYDSTLGLRHGPKFMIDEQSMLVCFFSNQSYTRQYDQDLYNEIAGDGIAEKVIALSGKALPGQEIWSLSCDLDDIWLIFPYLLFAQMFAFEKSLQLGLTPDNPCPSGEVNRVVKGVSIYPFS